MKPAIARLLKDREFIGSISAFKYPRMPRLLQPILNLLVKQALRKELDAVNTVGDLQKICEHYLTQVIESTTTKLSFSGLDTLDSQRPHLFISNHHDIVMDPALVNYTLYHHGFDTVSIAIGDNLLQKPFIEDLMRLNKSFIVKRSAAGVRQKLAAYTNLSAYIHHTLNAGCPIWIAQREGRSKDGVDQTDAAIIKMLFMSQKKQDISFSDYINWLKIVPVTLSYEYHPCDQLIAHELSQKQLTGSYIKTEGEDVTSIVTGITGSKGHVHVAFGQPLKGNYESPEAVAQAIDRQMLSDFVCHPSCYIAARLLGYQELPQVPIDVSKEQEFADRLNHCSSNEREFFLRLYANPLLRQLGLYDKPEPSESS